MVFKFFRKFFSSEKSAEPVPARDEHARASSASTDDAYQRRLSNELKTFENDEDVHDLPEIFHYWSNKYLRPKLEQYGIKHPEHFFFKYSDRRIGELERPARLLSIGAGNCDMEARLAASLKNAGHHSFTIECTDINQTMLDRGAAHADELGVSEHLKLSICDFNSWQPDSKYDVIIANQCLHHVVELEHLFTAIHEAMNSESLFLTSDMIGRNGHQRWPEALELVQEFWKELPQDYRRNRLLKRHEEHYVNHDCSSEGFEGIRAQDILPLLVERFKFELFLPFANVINVFIDRPFGGNFNAAADWDRGFIDRVHSADEEAMLAGKLKPTQMLAVLRTEDFAASPGLWDQRMSPEQSVRPPSL